MQDKHKPTIVFLIVFMILLAFYEINNYSDKF